MLLLPCERADKTHDIRIVLWLILLCLFVNLCGAKVPPYYSLPSGVICIVYRNNNVHGTQRLHGELLGNWELGQCDVPTLV